MKQLLILFFACLLLVTKSYSQLFTFNFTGVGTCPTTQGSSLTLQPANATVSAVARTGLTCSGTNDCFNSSAWSTAATTDFSQYIEVSVTANAGYLINLNSLSFSTLRSSTGPVNASVAHDRGTGIFSANYPFAPGTSATNITWGMNALSSTPGATVKFRIYGWGASNIAGTMRISNLSLNATVTANSPLNFDYANGRIGICIAPDANARLNIDGNIFSNGKIAIGTTDITKIGSYSLAVNGDAIFNKVRVKLYASWPDFVFADNYALRPLTDVERFIKANKHLPDVPSENIINKDGIDLGSTQAILLQKIEELTLYAIEQNRQLQLQQKNNIQQQQQIKKLRRDLIKLNQNFKK